MRNVDKFKAVGFGSEPYTLVKNQRNLNVEASMIGRALFLHVGGFVQVFFVYIYY